jgi:hypothetical protein
MAIFEIISREISNPFWEQISFSCDRPDTKSTLVGSLASNSFLRGVTTTGVSTASEAAPKVVGFLPGGRAGSVAARDCGLAGPGCGPDPVDPEDQAVANNTTSRPRAWNEASRCVLFQFLSAHRAFSSQKLPNFIIFFIINIRNIVIP